MNPLIVVILVGLLGIGALVLAAVLFNFFGIWIRAWSNGADVGILDMVGMRLQGIPVSLIVDARIMALKAGMDIDVKALQHH